jgi:hypothetical protein
MPPRWPGRDPADRPVTTAPALDPTHAYLREGQERDFLAQAYHHREADAGEAQAGQGPAQATAASARPRPGAVAGERGARTSRLLRGARQQPGHQRLPPSRRTALVTSAATPQPAPPSHLEADGTPHCSMASPCPHPASLPRGALRRSNPRQEPSAVVPHAGICAGGRSRGRSLPQSRCCSSPPPPITTTRAARGRGGR